MFILDYVIYRIVAVILEMFWDKTVLVKLVSRLVFTVNTRGYSYPNILIPLTNWTIKWHYTKIVYFVSAEKNVFHIKFFQLFILVHFSSLFQTANNNKKENRETPRRTLDEQYTLQNMVEIPSKFQMDF
jgi:hypothetical protein